MDQFKNPAGLIGKIAEDPHISWAGLGTGRYRPTLRQARVKAEITFINGSSFLMKIPCIIGTSGHAGLAADTE